jgi:hypothetical protein
MEKWFAKLELGIDKPAATTVQQMFDSPNIARGFIDTDSRSVDTLDTNTVRLKTMARFITVTSALDLWLYIEFDVPCNRCQTPLSQYSEIFVCDICSDGARRLCLECITRRSV